MATYLDFEEKIREVQDSIVSAQIRNDYPAVEIFEKKLDEEVEKTYANLTPYQKLQLARHPDRPYSVDYIRGIFDISYELHGDRHFSDDQSIVGYLGFVGDQKLMIIGEQKGRGTKNKIKRNFGMPHPEGYRKALRLAKLAEKFDVPVLFLIDTPGAYPGLGAEERNQSEAIARNLQELSRLENITISVVIGEGGSGGALAIGVADKLAMMRYSVFSVISPEGCAAILWNDPEKVETATQALKITSNDLKELNLIDDIIEEPLIGAHRDKTGSTEAIKNYVLESIRELKEIPKQERIEKRFNKIISYGAFEEEILNEVQTPEILENSETAQTPEEK